MEQPKPIWKSKTFWFNFLAFVLSAAAILADPVQYGEEVAKWATVVITAGNIILRVVTSQPVSLPGSPDAQREK